MCSQSYSECIKKKKTLTVIGSIPSPLGYAEECRGWHAERAVMGDHEVLVRELLRRVEIF